MKGFWKRKLPACLLALAMMVSVVPAASAASPDLTYDVDEYDDVKLNAYQFDDLYDDLCGGNLEYIEFSSYDDFDDYGYFEFEDFDGRYDYAEYSDLDEYRFYYDYYYYVDDDNPDLDSLYFVTEDDIYSDSLDFDIDLYGSEGWEEATIRIDIEGGSKSSSGDVEITYQVDPGDEVSLSARDFEKLFDSESSDYFECLEFYGYDDFDDYGYFEAYDYYGEWDKLTDSYLDDAYFYYDWEDTKDTDEHGLSGMTFYADKYADEDTLEFPFTMYGDDDDRVDGTLYIEIGKGSGTSTKADLVYEVDPNDDVVLDAEDFYDFFTEVRNRRIRLAQHYTLLVEEWFGLLTYLEGLDKKRKASLMAKVAEILAVGRGLNFGIWLCVQRADASLFSGGSREQFQCVLSFGRCSREQFSMLGFAGEMEENPTGSYGAGQALALIDGQADVQEILVPWITNREAMCREIRTRLDRQPDLRALTRAIAEGKGPGL